MLKTKKLLAVMLSFCMILTTLFIPVTATSENEITLTYWNADTSAIQLEFNNGIAVSDLEKYLSVTTGGEKVEYTIKTPAVPASTLTTTKVWTEISDAKADIYKGTLYSIVLKDGIKIDTPYIVTVTEGLTSADNKYLLKDNICKVIKVKKYIHDGFDYADNDALNKVYINHNGTMAVSNGALEITGAGVTVHPYGGGQFADYTEGKASQWQQAWGMNKKGEPDVTVSVKVKMSGEKEQDFQLYANRTSSTPHSFGDYINDGATNATRLRYVNKTFITMDTVSEADGKRDVNYRSIHSTEDYALGADYKEVKIVTKGTDVFGFVDNTLVSGIENFEGENVGSFAFRTKNGNTYTLDDLYITKAVEITGDPIGLTYWNADTSAIQLEFNNGIAVSDLEKYLSVTTGGEKVEYTIKTPAVPESTLETTKVWTEISDAKADLYTGTLYSIVLKDGIKIDTPYIVTVTGGLTSADNKYLLKDNICKVIKVKKYIHDGFDYADNDALNKVYINHNGTMAVSNGALEITGAGVTVHPYGGGQFADYTEGKASQWQKAWGMNKKGEPDVTVSVKVKMSGTNASDFQLYANRTSSTPHSFSNDINDGATNATRLRYVNKTFITMDTVSQVDGLRDVNYRSIHSTEDYALGADYKEVKIVTKGTDVFGFVDNTLVSGIENFEGENVGSFAFRTTNGNTYTLDDLYITKAVEVTGLEYEGLTVFSYLMNSNITLDSSFGTMGTCDFKVSVTNYSNEDTVNSVLALYKGKKMIGSKVVSATVPFGNSVITIPEVDVTGADNFKIFTFDFDGVKKLNTYFDTITLTSEN